jgi:hypothetical protein
MPRIEQVSVVPLGLKVGDTGLYKIKVSELFLPDSIEAYLVDKYENIELKLNDFTTYKFTTNSGTFRDRFEIIMKNYGTQTSQKEAKKEADFVDVYSHFMTIYVKFKMRPNEKVNIIIYDVAGRKVNEYQTDMMKSSITLDEVAQGFYSVVVKSGNNIITKKVLLRRRF